MQFEPEWPGILFSNTFTLRPFHKLRLLREDHNVFKFKHNMSHFYLNLIRSLNLDFSSRTSGWKVFRLSNNDNSLIKNLITDPIICLNVLKSNYRILRSLAVERFLPLYMNGAYRAN